MKTELLKPAGKKSKNQNADVPESANLGRQKFWLCIASLVLIPLAIYWPSLHAPFIFDDMGYIVENQSIGKFEHHFDAAKSKDDLISLKASRPLTFLTFDFNYRIGRLDTFTYHLFNLIVHISCSILMFVTVKSILKANSPPDVCPAAWFASVLFAAHPINTEVVSYISHRSESLAALFFLSAFFLFVQSEQKKSLPYAGSLLCFVFSLASKETATTLPIIILAYDYIFRCDYKISPLRAKIFHHLPYWAILAAYVGARQRFLGQVGDIAAVTSEAWTPWSYLTAQIAVVMKYVKLLLIPMGQSIDHFILPYPSIFEPKILLSLSIGFVLIAAVFFTFKRGSTSKLAFFSLLWFLITLLPTSSIFPINDAMAERRLYLPGIGFFVLLAMLILKIFKFNFKAAGAFALIHIVILSSLAWGRNRKYNDPKLLWEEAVSLYPNNFRALNNLGRSYLEKMDFKNALEYFQKSAQANPRYLGPNYNIGNLYMDLGDWRNSKIYFEREIQLDPRSDSSHNNLGLVFSKIGDSAGAELHYRKAIEINPNNFSAYGNLGNLCALLKRNDEAIDFYMKAMQINPSSGNADVIRNAVQQVKSQMKSGKGL